jgi:phosphoesterase RecJ-like protein
MAINQLKKIIEEIKKHTTIVIVRHVRPDGDCLGSSIGLRELIFRSFPEKKVFSVGYDKVEGFDFLGHEDENIPDSQLKGALFIVVDTSNKERISFHCDIKEFADKIIKIDHHLETDPFGDINYVLTDYPATAAIIAEMAEQLKADLKMTTDAAIPLYTGIVTDTQRFKVGNVNKKLFQIVAYLMQFNINLSYIYDNLYVKDSEELDLIVYVYSNYEVTSSGVGYIYFSQKMLKKNKIMEEEVAGCVNLLDSIRGMLIWMVFVEAADGAIRVSMRSRSVEIRSIASHYRGGGHLYACGAKVISEKEMKKLINETDYRLEEYKKSNPDKF